MSDPATTPDGYGLDKAARLDAQRAAKAAADKAPALNPDFPYRVEPFPFKDILQTQQLAPATQS